MIIALPNELADKNKKSDFCRTENHTQRNL